MPLEGRFLYEDLDTFGIGSRGVVMRVDRHFGVPCVGVKQFKIKPGHQCRYEHVKLRICKTMKTLMFNVQPPDGIYDLRKSGTLSRPLGIWYKVMFKALSLWLVKIQPALGHESMRIGEDFRVDLKKGGSHAAYRLRGVSGRHVS